MEILKEGKDLKSCYFICPVCGCEFKETKHHCYAVELNPDNHHLLPDSSIFFNNPYYTHECANCNCTNGKALFGMTLKGYLYSKEKEQSSHGTF